jgi:3-methyl-2-oxobutanoate hydroxymethyltransferase
MSAEESAPYGQAPAAQPAPVPAPPARIRTHHLARAKETGQRFAMVTAYDQYMAGIFDEAGIEVLLVGDSAANNVLGHETTLPITLDEMVMFSKAVTAGSRRALVVADLPFGSYQVSPGQAVESAVRLMKEARVHAVKLEGGAHFAEHVRAVVRAGIPVMGHVGFTPQSEHALGGYRIQGRGDAARGVVDDALAIEAAGAFSVLMEMVPADTAAEADRALKVPTVGIGAGAATTGQVLVWQDMLGLGNRKAPRFVKQYADLRSIVSGAARAYREDVLAGTFPAAEHSY